MSPVIRCPICGRMFDQALTKSMPFCSERCRQIDLGRWLREGYSVPVVRSPEDEEEDAGPPADRHSGDE